MAFINTHYLSNVDKDQTDKKMQLHAEDRESGADLAIT